VNAIMVHMINPRAGQQRVAFGTSGHRGSAFDRSFND
jgi:phosphoglucomutase